MGSTDSFLRSTFTGELERADKKVDIKLSALSSSWHPCENMTNLLSPPFWNMSASCWIVGQQWWNNGENRAWTATSTSRLCQRVSFVVVNRFHVTFQGPPCWILPFGIEQSLIAPSKSKQLREHHLREISYHMVVVEHLHWKYPHYRYYYHHQ